MPSLAYAVIINAKVWKKLPGDLQKILASALKSGRDWSRDETDRQDAVLIKKFRKILKVHELSADARAGFVKASRAVHDKFAKVVTRDLLDRAYAAAKGR